VTEGLLFAVASALSFGVSDMFAALVSRRLGAIAAAAGILLVSFLSLVVVAVLTRPTFPDGWSWAVPVALLGVLTGFAYLSLVNALRLGPVSVVGPLGATGGAIVVVLAVVLLGNRPAPLEWTAVVVTTAGAVLVALVRAPGERPRLNGPGPLFALAAVGGYAFSVIGLQGPIREVGWLQTLVVWRAANVVVASTVFLATSRRRAATQPAAALPSGDVVVPPLALSRWRLALPVALLLAGLLESSGQTLRAFALDVAPAWLVGVANPLGPIVVVTAGVLLFGERLRPPQLLGMGLVCVGLVLLSVA
jgi:drug/metabolite transporter (DMT)-like permease